MKKYFLILLFTLSVCYSEAQNNAETEKTIRGLEDIVIKGILESDTNMLKTVWAPEFLVNTPRNNIAEDRAAVLKAHVAGLLNYSSFERIIEKIEIHENFVITMGSETFVSRTDIPGAKAGQVVKRRFTNIWKNKDGKWMQIARHASIVCS
jgi:hypothetical protein